MFKTEFSIKNLSKNALAQIVSSSTVRKNELQSLCVHININKKVEIFHVSHIKTHQNIILVLLNLYFAC